MKLTVLNDDNIKILLEKDDLKKYEISFASIDYKNPKTKEVFWNVINTAKEEIGFNPTGSKLLIEAFPKSNGEVLLYVTRLPEEAESRAFGDAAGKSYLFCFDTADSFLDSLNAVNSSGLEIIEKRFYSYQNRYYLYFFPNVQNRCYNKMMEKLMLYLFEYLDEITPVSYRYFLE